MKQRVVIIMEGGIIQQVIASDPVNVEVAVVDHDTEGVDEERLSKIGEDGEVAVITEMTVDDAPIFVSWVFHDSRESTY